MNGKVCHKCIIALTISWMFMQSLLKCPYSLTRKFQFILLQNIQDSVCAQLSLGFTVEFGNENERQVCHNAFIALDHFLIFQTALLQFLQSLNGNFNLIRLQNTQDPVCVNFHWVLL